MCMLQAMNTVTSKKPERAISLITNHLKNCEFLHPATNQKEQFMLVTNSETQRDASHSTSLQLDSQAGFGCYFLLSSSSYSLLSGLSSSSGWELSSPFAKHERSSKAQTWTSMRGGKLGERPPWCAYFDEKQLSVRFKLVTKTQTYKLFQKYGK